MIAEVKRRSPSRGDLAIDLDPATLAAAYATGGAACLSVLTDAPHFGGSAADLAAARAASGLPPTLRKDFTVAPADLYDARLMGADAVLLIVAALNDGELTAFLRLGAELGLACLVEVHDETELQRALGAGASIIGVNQRDLRTFEVDGDRARRLAASIPNGVVSVAESGIRSHEDVAALVDAGFHAILVGEAARHLGRPAAAAIGDLVGSAAAYARARARPMFVKVCGVTCEEDALIAVAMGADAVGFVFAPSSRQVFAPAVAQITARLPAQVVTVGVFRDELPERVVEIVGESGLVAAQLHGHETPEDVALIAKQVRHVIKAFAATSSALGQAARYAADAILVDGPDPGSGRVFDWRLAEGLPRTRRVIIAGGLNGDNVGEAIRSVHPWGVDASSGLESEPGRKDPRLVRAFVRAARAAAPDNSDEPSLDGPYDWQDQD